MNSEFRIWFQASREISLLNTESNLFWGPLRRQKLLVPHWECRAVTGQLPSSILVSTFSWDYLLYSRPALQLPSIELYLYPCLEFATYNWCGFQASGLRKCIDPFRSAYLSEWITFSTLSGVNDEWELRWISRWSVPPNLLLILTALHGMMSQKIGI
jgi:hypothetical protein